VRRGLVRSQSGAKTASNALMQRGALAPNAHSAVRRLRASSVPGDSSTGNASELGP